MMLVDVSLINCSFAIFNSSSNGGGCCIHFLHACFMLLIGFNVIMMFVAISAELVFVVAIFTFFYFLSVVSVTQERVKKVKKRIRLMF